jgi:2-oxoisovalerate dehydrogenase E2 component (dihydrolipoyl transacylase)
MPAFLLPDLGEGLTEAEIVTWHVQAGDTVIVDQPIVEVETAKAVVEVPVPFGGRVTALHGQPGDVVAVGEPLVTVDTADRFAEPGVVTTPAGPDQASESGNVLIGYGTSGGRRSHPGAWLPRSLDRYDGRRQRCAAQRPVARCLTTDQAARPERRR